MIKTEHRQINDGYKLKESHLNDRRHELETKANGHQVPVVWDSAVDYNVFDKDGNKWIDMTAGIFAANAGHSNLCVSIHNRNTTRICREVIR